MVVHINPMWAGYGWHNSVKSAAQWTVPSFPWKTPLSASEKANQNGMSIWAGIGGSVAEPYIEQTGIYERVEPNGITSWHGFYEFYPYPAVAFGGDISPGDTMFASVSRSGVNYTLTLRDAGPHHTWVVSITKAFGHVESTAEAIVEDYAYSGVPGPLTGFSPVTFQTSGVLDDSWSPPWGTAVKNSSQKFTVISNAAG